jgi:hypothetical protein
MHQNEGVLNKTHNLQHSYKKELSKKTSNNITIHSLKQRAKTRVLQRLAYTNRLNIIVAHAAGEIVSGKLY